MNAALHGENRCFLQLLDRAMKNRLKSGLFVSSQLCDLGLGDLTSIFLSVKWVIIVATSWDQQENSCTGKELETELNKHL